jgi:hypothetical protein
MKISEKLKESTNPLETLIKIWSKPMTKNLAK